MDPSPSRVADYLDRIGYDGPAAATPETLTRIHRAHMLAVPFENLDIHLGVPIVLSVPAFYEKIVTRAEWSVTGNPSCARSQANRPLSS